MNADQSRARTRGGGRFLVRERLHEGRFFDLERVFDQERGREVALKVARSAEPLHREMLNDEHTSYASARRSTPALRGHRHLADYMELFLDDTPPFLSMELVEGLRFDEVVAREPRSPTQRGIELIKDALKGLAALHKAGVVHGGISPAAIRVAGDKRVVLLDRAGRQLAGWGARSDEEALYVAPEVGEDGDATEASDLYSLGVLLASLLLGELPTPPARARLRQWKEQEVLSQALLRFEGTNPYTVVQLAIDLLSPEPSARPSAEDCLGTLARHLQSSSIHLKPVVTPPAHHREQQAQLEAILGETPSGRPLVVHVHGPAGVGKTGLVERALEGERGVVLRGRCTLLVEARHDALQGVMLDFVEALRDDPHRPAFLPKDLQALARVFPAFQLLDELRGVPLPAPGQGSDPLAKGIDQLRRLLIAYTASRPLLVWIDDAQWADTHSVAVLEGLLRASPTPALTLILSYRREPVGGPEESIREIRLRPGEREIVVPALSIEEAARWLARVVPLLTPEQALVLARSTEGRPALLRGLVHELDELDALPERLLRPGGWLSWQLDRLPPLARQVLRACALARVPLSLPTLRRVHGGEFIRDAVDKLVDRELLGWRRRLGALCVDLTHDGLRVSVLEATAGCLDDVAMHLALAEALHEDADPHLQVVGLHFEAGGRPDRARACVLQAAGEALQRLAYARAAEMLQKAIYLGEGPQRELRLQRARCLSWSGQLAEAAQVLVSLADEQGDEGAAWRHRLEAGELYLRAGMPEGGARQIRACAEAAGLILHTGSGGIRCWLQLAWLRLLVTAQSLRPTATGEAVGDELIRLETCWTLAQHAQRLDQAKGVSFRLQHRWLAFRSDDVRHQVLALAAEAGYRSLLPSRLRLLSVDRLLARARELMRRSQEPERLELAIRVAECGNSLLRARWDGVIQEATEILEGLPGEQAGGWARSETELRLQAALLSAGRLDEARARSAELQAAARLRADVYTNARLQLADPLVDLADGQAEQALARARSCLSPWKARQPPPGVLVPWVTTAVSLLLYLRRPEEALEEVQQAWMGLEHGLDVDALGLGSLARQARVRASIAAALGGASLGALRGPLRRDQVWFARSSLFIDQAYLAYSRAALSLLDGAPRGEARVELELAVRQLELAGMPLRRDALRLQLARLAEDPGLDARRAQLAARGVRDPERFAAALLPLPLRSEIS